MYAIKVTALMLAFQMFLTAIGFGNVYANGGGPTQPEVHSFEPIGTNQMVDLFTGDFTYNIPLFNIPGPDGGYPINLSYHSGPTMEQEASWVGLGWNINVGTINRQIRNLPDDFGGEDDYLDVTGDPDDDEHNDRVTIKTDMRPNWTVGVGGRVSYELFGFDTGGGQTGSVGGSISFSGATYYNNYKGVGQTMGIGFNASFGKASSGIRPIAGDLGFNLKMDTQEGIDASISTGISHSTGNKTNNAISVGTGYNSRVGWKRNLQIQASTQNGIGKKIAKKGGGFRESKAASSLGGGSNLSFSHVSTQMSVPQQMRGGNGQLSFGTGLNAVGNMFKWGLNGFFSFSRLKNKDKAMPYKGVGYMYYQRSKGDNYKLKKDYRVLDVARDGGGLVHEHTRRLGSPILSYDIYSVTGQGIGNMFRPYRSDIGTIQEPRKKSEFHGGNFGLEQPVTATPINHRFGFEVGYNYAHTKTDFWPNDNHADLHFRKLNRSLSESVYFQNYGENSVDNIEASYGATVASERPVVYGLEAKSGFYDIKNYDVYNGNDDEINLDQTNNLRTERKRRAVGVEALTNDKILDVNYGSTVIPEFDIDVYTSTASITSAYNKANIQSYHNIRSGRVKTHVGGYMATNPQGMRYVYALPAYNNNERDVTFTVAEHSGIVNNNLVSIDTDGDDIDYKKEGTDKYYQSVEKSGYAHSYMLTSILGTEYVDYDSISGPSDGDLGYWVKFDYARAHGNMKWRAPFEKGKALYDRGYEMSSKDGKGSYSYGEKEVWYLATAETKTHIAEFILGDRDDAKQPGDEFKNVAPTENGYKRLVRIDVYAKSERYPNGQFNANAKPIKSCHFNYNHSLCKGIPSNTNGGGKLTLTDFYFTYRGNQTGASTPYVFHYNTEINGTEAVYNQGAVDRWGNYQPVAGGANIDYPYNSPFTSKADMDARAGIWSLKAIDLPSGGRYEIDYESDSYAYVQNEVAMHMYPIVSLDEKGPSPDDDTGHINHHEDAPSEHRKVYFELEQPISGSLPVIDRNNLLRQYIRPGEYMYFKVKINVTTTADSKEMVAGYAKVQDINVDPQSVVNGSYTRGYVQLDLLKVNGETTSFHPFTEVGARHIKYNHPDILYATAPNANKEKLSKGEMKNMAFSLMSNSMDIATTFRGFTKALYGNGQNKRLREIELGKSFIRLRTPDKIKYGGGHRVKEIRVIDNWQDAFAAGSSTGEMSSTYATVYDYNMEDDNGRIISSGVAAYEPLVGGDEIPLRKPVEGWEDKNVQAKTLAQIYSEEPGNESLFPGPTVGYRQVRVMSKNTASKLITPAETMSYGGISVNEFYTAKDYPVQREVSELWNNKTIRIKRLMIPALIFNYDKTRMAATQGYYIELNDMHGKPKGGKEIGFNEDGTPTILSEVKYEYFDEEKLRTNDAGEQFKVRYLKNEVDVLYSDVDATDLTKSDIHSGTLATEVEFIPETRYNESKQISGGLSFNVENFYAIPWFIPVPNFNWRAQKTGTVVTNKIVNKSGILRKTTATTRGSVVETENLVFDQYTGTPLLTTVTNDYGDKVYGYSILSHDQYEGTGPAYKNIGLDVEGYPVNSLTNGLQRFTLPANVDLFPGDELLATPINDQGLPDDARNKYVCYFQKLNAAGEYVIETPANLAGQYRFTVIRSGRRNLLALPISSISALSNPTVNRQVVHCSGNYGTEDNVITRRKLDNVLSIDAVELGHRWYKDTRQISDIDINEWYDDAFYSKGMSGVYSGIRPYVYVDDRTQSETAGNTDVKLQVDGVMNDVYMFNWDHFLLDAHGCESKWKETSQITLKNPSGFDIESKNVLNTFSSSLFGKEGTEPIAVAANAKNTEIGFENFEEYTTGALPISKNSTNNMNFYSSIDQTNRQVEDRFDVFDGLGASGAIIASNALLNQYSDYTLRLHVDGYNDKGSEHLLRVSPTFTQPSPGLSHALITNFSDLNLPNWQSRVWRGELFAKKTIPNYPASGTNPDVQVVAGIAHTGEQCLEVGNTNGADFLQGRLTLQEGEKYQFSGWFSSPNNRFLLRNHNQLFDGNVKLEFFDMSGALVSTQTYKESDILVGNFIEDWQKFSIDFTMPPGAHYVSAHLPRAKEVYDSATDDYIRKAYYDDMRIQPLDGGMSAYVYNRENQRLEAELDGNNYATFYYYDDEGNLFLVKRETAKGIITVQESRSYLKRN